MSLPNKKSDSLESNAEEDSTNCRTSVSSLLRSVRGVAVATKATEEHAEQAISWVLTRRPTITKSVSDLNDGEVVTLSFSKWRDEIASNLIEEGSLLPHILNIALCVTFLREKCRQAKNSTISTTVLASIWEMISKALISISSSTPSYSASRSAQGFLAVPLCSLVKDGDIEELFRLHVWLPDGQRGSTEYSIHAHQPFAQSWILTGEGKDQSWNVKPATDASAATHAEFALAWNDGKQSGTKYATHQASSVVLNTGTLAQATLTGTAIHKRGSSYSIPSGAFHRTEVAPDILHATLFFFDSHRGFQKDARVLGPIDGESFTQLRDPAGMTPSVLTEMVNLSRSWEDFMLQGQQHASRAEWESALQDFNSALNLCQSLTFPNAIRYKRLVLGELGNTNRRFGRYEEAKDILEEALRDMEASEQRIEFEGELGVIFRHMNRLVDAKHAFENQYNTAKQIKAEFATCRAVGNLGMVNYQLSQQNKDSTLLDLAIEQLVERVQRARVIKSRLESSVLDSITSQGLRTASTWESIGLSRLSLCYAARGDTKMAISAAAESMDLNSTSEDPTVIAMTHLLYGRALFLDGQPGEALKHFNPLGACTPAIALCKEPSDEHRQYLTELVEAGADMDRTDDHGYTALDYAVFNGDLATEKLVLEGLKRNLSGDVDLQLKDRQNEAQLRRGYRVLFQEKLRPVLLSGGDVMHKLRQVYAEALATDEEQRKQFDGLKFIRYSDFLKIGKLPRSSEGVAQQFSFDEKSGAGDVAKFMIFFSYRWINKDKTKKTPDDENNTQYKRMVAATEEFLKLHPDVDRESLGLWVDHTCVDQDNPMPGVCALPMVIAQCNALISLVDDLYHSRAWCSVEVMMIQTLKRSYNLHLWYEHVIVESGGDDIIEGVLNEAPIDLRIDMKEKDLTFESDRPKVLFLERQSKLLA